MIYSALHIHINAFGNENQEYITREFSVKCFENGAHGVMSMLNQIFFNADHKENHNVRLQSLKNQLVEVFHDEQWVTKGFHEAVSNMITISSGKIINDALPIVQETRSAMEVVTSLNEMQNMEPNMKKSINEKTRAKLVERRKKTKVTIVEVSQ